MTALDTLRSLRTPGTSLPLDFSNPVCREGVLALYGGEAAARERFPQLCRALECSCENPSLARPVGEPTDFADGALIDAVTWTREDGKLTVRAATSLLEPAYFIDEHLEVRTAAGEIVGGLAQSTVDACHSELVFETDFDPQTFASDVLEIDYASNWVTAGERQLRGMLTSKDAHEEAYLSTQVKAVHVLKPVKKTAGKTAPVNICYNRFPLAEEDTDYLFQESFSSGTGVQRLFAPVAAWVEFELDEQGRQDAFSRIDITTFHLKMDCQNGIARYDTTGRETLVERHFVAQPDSAKTHPSGFSFELDPEWKADVPARRWPKRDRVDLLMEVEFEHESGKRGSFELSTTADRSQGNVGKVDWMNLLWGCVKRGTRVLMADGSERPIEDVRPGDRVLCDAQGGSATVRDVLRGTEERLVAFSTTNGRQLLCTADHPLFTNEGTLTAEQVHGNCRLYGPDGGELVLDGIWDLPGDEVYNLCLEMPGADGEGGTFFAEGILVGDNALQGSLAWARSRAALADNPFRAECEEKARQWAEDLL